MSTALIEALENASEADLAAVDEKIQDYSKKLDAYQQTRRLLEKRLGVQPLEDRSHRKKKSSSSSSSSPSGKGTKSMEYRLKLATCLISRGGGAKVLELAREADVPEGSISAALDHEWFTRKDGLVHITPAGRQANG